MGIKEWSEVWPYGTAEEYLQMKRELHEKHGPNWFRKLYLQEPVVDEAEVRERARHRGERSHGNS